MKEQHAEQRKKVGGQIDDGAETHRGKEFSQQCEHAIRRELNQDADHLHDDDFHVAEPVGNPLARLA